MREVINLSSAFAISRCRIDNARKSFSAEVMKPLLYSADRRVVKAARSSTCGLRWFGGQPTRSAAPVCAGR
jgi:hypothetical protein